jgi:hypothetical protein
MNYVNIRTAFLIENFVSDLIMSHPCSRVIHMNETTNRYFTIQDQLDMAATNRGRAAVHLAQWVAMGNDPTCPVALRASTLRCVQAGNQHALLLEQGAFNRRYGYNR